MKIPAEKNFLFPQHAYVEEDYFASHEKLLKFLAAAITSGERKILDIGCATGLLYLLLSDYHTREIYGIDVEADFIAAFNERFGAGHGKTGNIERERLPFSDNEFDLIVCNSVLEHTLMPKQLIAEAHRVLKPGGRAIFVVPNALSFMHRWNLLRGRNVFTPLIDNLLHKSYQKRCAVFYSAKDLHMALDPVFHNLRITFFNDESNLKNNQFNVLEYSVIKTVRYFFPQWRDTIIVEVIK